jgi:hypothetical protein
MYEHQLYSQNKLCLGYFGIQGSQSPLSTRSFHAFIQPCRFPSENAWMPWMVRGMLAWVHPFVYSGWSAPKLVPRSIKHQFCSKWRRILFSCNVVSWFITALQRLPWVSLPQDCLITLHFYSSFGHAPLRMIITLYYAVLSKKKHDTHPLYSATPVGLHQQNRRKFESHLSPISFVSHIACETTFCRCHPIPLCRTLDAKRWTQHFCFWQYVYRWKLGVSE